MKTLEELRKEIDQVDKQLHNLLVRRIEIGREVAKAKKINSGFNLRPGREAQIMKRLVLRNTPPLSTMSIYRIWREILSANLNQQTQIKAAAYLPERYYYSLAKDYSGSSSKITEFASSREVLDQVANGLAHIGMVPGFWDGVDGEWWGDFAESSRKSAVKVISVVPMIKREGATRSLAIIAKQKPEETGDDSSLFAIKGEVDKNFGCVIRLGPHCLWQLVLVDGYKEILQVPEGVEYTCLGNFANLIPIS